MDRTPDCVADRLPAVAEHLEAARADILPFIEFPKDVWAQIWSNNPNGRLNREIRRRTDSVGIFPNPDAIIRLVGGGLAEQTEEWAEGRRYLGLDVLARSRMRVLPNTESEVVTGSFIALSAYPKGQLVHHSMGLAHGDPGYSPTASDHRNLVHWTRVRRMQPTCIAPLRFPRT